MSENVPLWSLPTLALVVWGMDYISGGTFLPTLFSQIGF